MKQITTAGKIVRSLQRILSAMLIKYIEQQFFNYVLFLCLRCAFWELACEIDLKGYYFGNTVST